MHVCVCMHVCVRACMHVCVGRACMHVCVGHAWVNTDVPLIATVLGM